MHGDLLESVELELLEDMAARLLQDDETRVPAATHLARRLQAEVHLQTSGCQTGAAGRVPQRRLYHNLAPAVDPATRRTLWPWRLPL